MANWPERTLRLQSSVGAGDLATIYAAVDLERGGREFAVAMLHYDLKDIDSVAEAIARRIEAGREIDHPAIVRVEGVFHVSDRPAVIMELVAGKDLARLSRRRTIPVSIAARVGSDVVSFLVAAKAGALRPRRVVRRRAHVAHAR